MDYEKLKADVLKIFEGKSYIMTFDRENLADKIITAVRDQLEPKKVK